MVTCSFCGASAGSDTPPITWTSATDKGEQQWYCDDCSRTHLRAMESKLDAEYW